MIFLITCDKVSLNGYEIATDMIYTKRHFIYSGVSQKHVGNFTIDLIMSPKNFRSDFNFYLMVVNEATWNKLQQIHDDVAVCVKDPDDNLTYLNINVTESDYLYYKKQQRNQYDDFVLQEKIEITQNGLFYAIF